MTSQMMTRFLVFLLSLLLKGSNQSPEEQRLLNDLFSNYTAWSRPVEDKDDVVTVKFSIQLNQIVNLIEKDQILTVNLAVRKEWNNPLLRWNASQYGGIKSINVPRSHVWIPDIVLYNNAKQDVGGDQFGTKVVVIHNGINRWTAPAIIKSKCFIDMSNFPFDEQVCDLNFGTLTYSTQWVDIESDLRVSDVDQVIDSIEWRLHNVTVEKKLFYHHCCPTEPFSYLRFKLHMKRQYLFDVFNLILPYAIISAASLVELLLPAYVESGERVSLLTSILVSLIFYLNVVRDRVPYIKHLMEKTPLIGKYYICTMVEITFSIATTLVILRFFYVRSVSGNLPKWQRPLIYWLSRLVRVHRRGFQNKTTIRELFGAMKSFDIGEDKFKDDLDSVEILSCEAHGIKMEQITAHSNDGADDDAASCSPFKLKFQKHTEAGKTHRLKIVKRRGSVYQDVPIKSTTTAAASSSTTTTKATINLPNASQNHLTNTERDEWNCSRAIRQPGTISYLNGDLSHVMTEDESKRTFPDKQMNGKFVLDKEKSREERLMSVKSFDTDANDDKQICAENELENRFADGVSVLTAHAQEQDEKERRREEWKFASEVLDRLFKLAFLFAFIIMHIVIFVGK